MSQGNAGLLFDVLPKLWDPEAKLPDHIEIHSRHDFYAGNCRVFSFSHQLGIIYKAARASDHQNNAQVRWNNIQRAEAVVRIHGLDKLRIPKATFGPYELENKKRYDVLTCQKLEFLDEKPSTEALIQLGRLILHTGLNDVEHRNVPVIAGGKIALIDPDSMRFGRTEIATGIHGSVPLERTGLLGHCKDEEQPSKAIPIGPAVKKGVRPLC